jgi:F-type H+-transporting ATPase subunit b
MEIQVLALPVLSSMFLTWVALALLYFGLRKFMYKPVSEFLNERKAKIASDIEGAKALNEEAKALRQDYESRIDLAKKESQEILEGARKRGEELKENIVDEAKKEAEAIVSRARREIIREREVAMQDIKSQAGEMAILIASKIMEQDVKMDTQNNLIDKFIDEVGTSQWQS